jgi:predicted DNA-binding transcriptional regulator YafY
MNINRPANHATSLGWRLRTAVAVSQALSTTNLTFEIPDEALAEWLALPRIPVLASEDPVVVSMINAMLARRNVEFVYYGGSSPGSRRLVSPGLVFALDEWSSIYVAGYCHTRQEERVFRCDRIMPLEMLN